VRDLHKALPFWVILIAVHREVLIVGSQNQKVSCDEGIDVNEFCFSYFTCVWGR